MANRYPPPYRDPYRQQPPAPAPGGEPFGGDRKDFLAGMMMPKTVVQLSIWILMFGLGAGLAGLLLFVVYQSQVNAMEGRIIESQTELENKLEERLDELEKREPQASATLNVSAASDSSERTRSELIRNVAPGIVGIRGTDSAGKATNGTGFIVNTTDQGSWVLTNYQLVAGSRPDSSAVQVRMGPAEIAAEVFEVDPGADLALVVLNVSGKKTLRFTRGELKEGDPVWVFSTARGNPGATAQEAHLVAYGPNRVVVDIDPPAQFNGGPVIDSQGRVVGVLSSKAPTTSTSKSTGTSAPPSPATASRGATPIKYACNLVLQCPGTRPKAEPSATPAPAQGAQASPQPTKPATQPAGPTPAPAAT